MNPRRLLPLLGLCSALAFAQTPVPAFVDAARGPVPIDATTRPAPLRNAVNDDVRPPRSFDAQPPTIPHRVDGYQVDRNFNKCLDCHARGKTEVSQAVPVSPTHYLDRGGRVLAHVSTRRYFCMQCHVAQDPVQPIVGNTFENVADLAGKAPAPSRPVKR